MNSLRHVFLLRGARVPCQNCKQRMPAIFLLGISLCALRRAQLFIGAPHSRSYITARNLETDFAAQNSGSVQNAPVSGLERIQNERGTNGAPQTRILRSSRCSRFSSLFRWLSVRSRRHKFEVKILEKKSGSRI